MTKIGFLYYGRLEHEKGFKDILEMIKIFGNQNKDLPFEFYIFGKGKLESELIKLSNKYSSIHFFGRQSLDYIKQYLPKIQYLFMPSTFLETFGLSALNSLSRGLPVIGFAKGGLTPFILDGFDLTDVPGINTAWKLHNMVNKLISNTHQNTIQKTLDISSNYTKEKRIKNFQKQFGSNKKILMISDFKTKIGGIETYIHDTKELLGQNGYELKIFGYKLAGSRLSKLKKYIGIFFAIGNIPSYFKIKRKINKFEPDIIRYHSTLRRIGRMGILASKSFKGKKIVMYHDFGYFHPFPNKLNFVDDVQKTLNMKNYIKSANTKNPIKIIAVIFKYISVYLIKNQLKKDDFMHLVPSEFMIDIISDSHQINKKNIVAFPHFIQE